jgi:predicted amino acid racemase
VISRTGRYRFFPIVGTAVLTGGVLLLTRLTSSTPLPVVALFMVVTGLGLGQVMQVLVLAVQNDVAQHDLGVATSAASFFRSLGGAFGTALFGAVLTNRLNHELPRLVSADRLREAGVRGLRVNAPGTTSTSVLPLLADAGATQVEPGRHGLTGTCPQHLSESEPEVPAALYLSEISHHHGGRAYCYGGGLYIDPVFPAYRLRALVSRGTDADRALVVDAEIPPPGAIDYHGMLDQPGGELLVGASVVFGFRIQAFFARCPVVGVRGVRSGRPHATTASDPDGASEG